MNLSVIHSSDHGWQLFASALLGALLGLERELARKDASFRTFSIVCMGSCLFTILSAEFSSKNSGVDSSRIAAQIVSGIGFLGGGVIFRSEHGISGLTTAALLWVTAAIGMTVGRDKLDLAFEATLLVLVYMLVFRFIHYYILGKGKNSNGEDTHKQEDSD
jgi:putative Mg2+ transporter-C (MgtC) family protein